MEDLFPNWSTPVIKFGHPVIRNLEKFKKANINELSSDGRLAWICIGSCLEVVSTRNGQRIASWQFGAILKDQNTCITSVKLYAYSKRLYLLVGSKSDGSRCGLLSIFDVWHSIVIRTVEFPRAITAIEIVTGDNSASNMVLSQLVHCFCGLAAIGTVGGYIYLLDLCMDGKIGISNELQPASLQSLDPQTNNATRLRYNAVSQGRHLCLQLGEVTHSRGYFYYKKPEGSISRTFSEDDVSVSLLHLILPTGTLVVAFNFGCFQLWRLQVPSLEYSSRMEVRLSPITHIAFQEPENDPRSFCYLWIVRGPTSLDGMEEFCPSMCLYHLSYKKKFFRKGFGTTFEELLSVGLRFQHDLVGSPFEAPQDESLNITLACHTLGESLYKMPDAHSEFKDDSFESDATGPDLSILTLLWRTQMPGEQQQYYMGLFDLNRWYQAQMPSAVRGPGSNSYIAFYTLSPVMENSTAGEITDLVIDLKSLSRFRSKLYPPPEQIYHPSSLAFKCIFLREGGLVATNFLGVQRKILGELVHSGPSLLLKPKSVFMVCLKVGLLSRNLDLSVNSQLPEAMREAIFSLALEYNCLRLIKGCIREWASGECNNIGCSLQSILIWAWRKLGSIKKSIDSLCSSLFEGSGHPFDRQAQAQLHTHLCALSGLDSVFQSLMNEAAPSTLQGQQDLGAKHSAVVLVRGYLNAIIWFHGAQLLPECSEGAEDAFVSHFVYPYSVLLNTYQSRRYYFENLHKSIDPSEMLCVDALVRCHGVDLRKSWRSPSEEEEGTGMYPPRSVHALLCSALSDHVACPETTHALLLYFLFDMLSLTPPEDREKFSVKLQQFTHCFAVPNWLYPLVKGMWLLDHNEPENAVRCLLNPYIGKELWPGQNHLIVKVLLYAEHQNLALRLLSSGKFVRQTEEDVKLELNVLLACGQISRAFSFQRSMPDRRSAANLFKHMCFGAQQTGVMRKLLQLPLSAEEEQWLEQFLAASQECRSSEVMLVHLLQGSRFPEAIMYNEKLKLRSGIETDAGVRNRAGERNAILSCYQRLLPRVQHKLASSIAGKSSVTRRRTVITRNPLTVVVTNSKNPILTKAGLLKAVLDKVDELPGSVDRDDGPGPFLSMPMTPRPYLHGVHSQLVFPDVSSPGLSAGLPDRRRRRLNDEVRSLLATTPTRRSARRRSAKPPTPQSILKIRQNLCGAKSPLLDTPDTRAVSKMQLATPPSALHRENLSYRLSVARLDTTKKLRFDVPASPNDLQTEPFVDGEFEREDSADEPEFIDGKEEALPDDDGTDTRNVDMEVDEETEDEERSRSFSRRRSRKSFLVDEDITFRLDKSMEISMYGGSVDRQVPQSVLTEPHSTEAAPVISSFVCGDGEERSSDAEIVDEVNTHYAGTNIGDADSQDDDDEDDNNDDEHVEHEPVNEGADNEKETSIFATPRKSLIGARNSEETAAAWKSPDRSHAETETHDDRHSVSQSGSNESAEVEEVADVVEEEAGAEQLSELQKCLQVSIFDDEQDSEHEQDGLLKQEWKKGRGDAQVKQSAVCLLKELQQDRWAGCEENVMISEDEETGDEAEMIDAVLAKVTENVIGEMEQEVDSALLSWGRERLEDSRMQQVFSPTPSSARVDRDLSRPAIHLLVSKHKTSPKLGSAGDSSAKDWNLATELISTDAEIGKCHSPVLLKAERFKERALRRTTIIAEKHRMSRSSVCESDQQPEKACEEAGNSMVLPPETHDYDQYRERAAKRTANILERRKRGQGTDEMRTRSSSPSHGLSKSSRTETRSVRLTRSSTRSPTKSPNRSPGRSRKTSEASPTRRSSRLSSVHHSVDHQNTVSSKLCDDSLHGDLVRKSLSTVRGRKSARLELAVIEERKEEGNKGKREARNKQEEEGDSTMFREGENKERGEELIGEGKNVLRKTRKENEMSAERELLSDKVKSPGRKKEKKKDESTISTTGAMSEFLFSLPTSVNSSKQEPEKQEQLKKPESLDIKHSFIFSPPVTRSRSVQKKLPLREKEDVTSSKKLRLGHDGSFLAATTVEKDACQTSVQQTSLKKAKKC